MTFAVTRTQEGNINTFTTEAKKWIWVIDVTHYILPKLNSTVESTREACLKILNIQVLQNKSVSIRRKTDTERNIVTTLYPWSENNKYIIETSAQKWCAMWCNRCDIEKRKWNLTETDILLQRKVADEIASILNIKQENIYKIGFTESGEILLNKNFQEIITSACENYPDRKVKISTTLPDTTITKNNIKRLLEFIKTHPQVSLQISLASTDFEKWKLRMKGRTMPFEKIKQIATSFSNNHPASRTPTLSFTLTTDAHVIPKEIITSLPPDLFKIAVCQYRTNCRGKKPITWEKLDTLMQEFRDQWYDVIWEFDASFNATQLMQTSPDHS